MGKGTVVRQSGSRRARRLGCRPSAPFVAGLPILNEAESARAHKAINPLGQALRTAAMTARRSQAVVGDMLRARVARKDAPVAITATARGLPA